MVLQVLDVEYLVDQEEEERVVGPHASDLIHEPLAIMRYRGTAEEMMNLPHYHPTLSEIWTYPAESIVEALRRSG